MPTNAGRRNAACVRVRQPTNSTAIGKPAHQAKPPSPIASIDQGDATYSGHQSAMYPMRAAIKPMIAASNTSAPARLAEGSGARIATKRAVSQAKKMATTTMTAAIGKGPTPLIKLPGFSKPISPCCNQPDGQPNENDARQPVEPLLRPI